jgi:hypothetical protein
MILPFCLLTIACNHFRWYRVFAYGDDVEDCFLVGWNWFLGEHIVIDFTICG